MKNKKVLEDGEISSGVMSSGEIVDLSVNDPSNPDAVYVPFNKKNKKKHKILKRIKSFKEYISESSFEDFKKKLKNIKNENDKNVLAKLYVDIKKTLKPKTINWDYGDYGISLNIMLDQYIGDLGDNIDDILIGKMIKIYLNDKTDDEIYLYKEYPLDATQEDIDNLKIKLDEKLIELDLNNEMEYNSLLKEIKKYLK